MTPTPRELGYAMPAEWAAQAATWLSWPHNRDTWPHDFDAVEQTWVDMAAALSSGQRVHVNVQDETHAAHVQGLLAKHHRVDMTQVHLHLFPTNDSWVRDHGPIFLTGPAGLAVVDFGYNAWGEKYPPYDLDNEIPRRVAACLQVPRFDAGMVLEGGSIEVDGQGAVLVSESCLLSTTRNPGLTQEQVEQKLRDFLGVDRVLWLPGCDMLGDDTDGHIDNLARFLPDGRLLAAFCADTGDENHAVLTENFRRAGELKDTSGKPYDVVPLLMPPPVVLHDFRTPASYVNYLVANGQVLLPTFGVSQDEEAARVLASVFPTRRVTPIPARAMIWGQGAVHCSTQQQPLASPDPWHDPHAPLM